MTIELLSNKRDSSNLQNGKFHFAIIGKAEGNEVDIFEQLHFALTELNLSCDFIKIRWHVLISKSEFEESA